MREALYRKHRPTKLSEVFGQKHITTTLTNALAKKSISHGYLFSGPRGVGKTSVARILAHQVNDFSYGDVNAKLDIIEIDAASNRKIDEIRELRDKINLAPVAGNYKVYIIDEVHMLTREAFNALLKTLEEPPKHVIFILATTELFKVPETIISRTQHFNFKAISNEELIKHLQNLAKVEKQQYDESALELIANHSGGSFRDGISILDQLSNEPKITIEAVESLLGVPSQEIVQKILQSILVGDLKSTLNALDTAIKSGIDSKRLCISLVDVIKDQIFKSNLLELIDLAKSILDASDTSEPFRELELILIDFCLQKSNLTKNTDVETEETTRIPEKATKTYKSLPPNQKEKIDSEFKNSTKTDNKSLKIIANLKPFNANDAWASLLASLKLKYNTLYSVARMAKVDYQNEEYLLTVEYPFHQRRLQAEKNATIIRQYFHEITGKPIKYQVLLNSNNSKKNSANNINPKSIIEPSDDNHSLSNVTNIFGGGELLET